jgi:acetyltransferase
MAANSAMEAATQTVLDDGTPLVLRPLRPADENLILDIAQHFSPDDLRLRFFTPVHELSHELLTRLSHIDKAREGALIALLADDETPLGAARFAETDRTSAEFALGVRSDWHRRGIGKLLLEGLAKIARARGITEFYGDVLRENEPMLAFSRHLGFTLERHPDDAQIVRARKRLA